MSFKNRHSLADNLELEMLHTAIIVVTIITLLFSAFADSGNEIKFKPWIYVVSISPVIFIATLFLKRFILPTLMSLAVIMISGMIYFRHSLFINYDEIYVYNIVIFSLHFLVILAFFINAAIKLKQSIAEQVIGTEGITKGKNTFSKLSRRRKRRNGFKSRNSTQVKSGPYRV